jgi:hypothetical protein
MIDLLAIIFIFSACYYVGRWVNLGCIYQTIELRKRLSASRLGGSITYDNPASRVYLARKLAELVSPLHPDKEFYKICRKYDVSLHDPL